MGKTVGDGLIYDEYLNPILEKASDEDLEPLTGYLKKKLSQSLTNHPRFVEHQPNHSKYADVIADEIRRMGGNSLRNASRGEGPGYFEIVCDVADKVKAKYKRTDGIETIEKSILEAILKQALDKMTDEEKQKLFSHPDFKGIKTSGVTSSVLLGMFEAGGFYSYQLAVIIANHFAHLVLGHGLSFATNAAITKGLSYMAGPIGWAVCAIWTTLDLSGPAYSVTVPCVVHIASLRIKANMKRCLSCSSLLPPETESKICSYCSKASKSFITDKSAFVIEMPIKMAKKINRSRKVDDMRHEKLKKKAAIRILDEKMKNLINGG